MLSFQVPVSFRMSLADQKEIFALDSDIKIRIQVWHSSPGERAIGNQLYGKNFFVKNNQWLVFSVFDSPGLLMRSLLFRHEFTTRCARDRSSLFELRPDTSQSTQRTNRKGTSKYKAFLCALCELCGENILLMLVHHVYWFMLGSITIHDAAVQAACVFTNCFFYCRRINAF